MGEGNSWRGEETVTGLYIVVILVAGNSVLLLLWMATVRAAERRNAGRNCRERQHFEDVDAIVSERFTEADEKKFHRSFQEYARERDAS